DFSLLREAFSDVLRTIEYVFHQFNKGWATGQKGAYNEFRGEFDRLPKTGKEGERCFEQGHNSNPLQTLANENPSSCRDTQVGTGAILCNGCGASHLRRASRFSNSHHQEHAWQIVMIHLKKV